MIKAVAYCRYSSDNQREESIDAQLRAITEYAKNKDYIIINTYIDEARSATTDNRPQFLSLIDDSSNKEFSLVIVHKLDRFARNRYDSAFYKKKLKDNGVRLVSVLENLDDSPESIILESMLEGMAEYYSKNLSREVMKGMKENALQGKHNGGVPPLGLNVVNGQYEINEPEANLIKEIFSLFLAGNGYANIANILNEHGGRTKTGRPFTKSSVHDILRNEKYIGRYVFNRRLSKKENHKNKSDDLIIRVDNSIPAIVDIDTFNEVQEKIALGKRGPRMDTERFYLLTGKLICGLCGSSYSGNGCRNGRNGKRYAIYSCIGREKNRSCANPRVRKETIESIVIKKLKDTIFNDTAIEKISAEMVGYLSERNQSISKDRKNINQAISEIDKKIDAAFELYYSSKINTDLLSKQTNKLKEEQDRLKKQLINMDDTDYSWITMECAKEYLTKQKNNLESDDPKLQKAVIDLFLDKIVIYPDRFEGEFKFEANSTIQKRRGERLMEARGVEPLSE
ncbi:MAG TPA: recombinase family protein, partial [Clostridia bacterium]